jgi:hypothetical protein
MDETSGATIHICTQLRMHYNTISLSIDIYIIRVINFRKFKLLNEEMKHTNNGQTEDLLEQVEIFFRNVMCVGLSLE